MKTKSIILALSLLIAIPGYGQFGGLKRGLQKKAKEKVEQLKREAREKELIEKNKAASKAAEATGVSTSSSSSSSSSVEAEGQVQKGTLDPKLYYAEDPNAYPRLHYFTRTVEWRDTLNLRLLKNFAESAKSFLHFRTSPLTNGYFIIKDGSKTVVPMIELPLYAWSKHFMENPTEESIKFLAMLMAYYDKYQFIEYPMDDAYAGVVDTKEGTMLYWPTESDMRKAQSDRVYDCMMLALQNISAKKLSEFALAYYGSAANFVMENQKEDACPSSLAIILAGLDRMAAEGLAKLCRSHADYDETAEYARTLKLGVAQFEWDEPNFQLYKKLNDMIMVGAGTPQELPKGIKVDASLRSRITSLAQKAVAKDAQVVFTTTNWKSYTSPEWPYKETHKSIPVIVVFKKYGKKVMQNWDVQKTGASYNIVAGMDSKIYPVAE